MKRFKHKLLCEALESRVNPAGTGSVYDHVASPLLRYYEVGDPGYLQFDAQQRVAVRVNTANVAATLPLLKNLGFLEFGSVPELNFTEGWLPISAVPAAEALGDAGQLRGVIAVFPPTPAVGVVTSEAAQTLRTQFVNDIFYTGFGVTVGVISDSYNLQKTSPTYGPLGGAAADQSTNDLPASVTVISEGPMGSHQTDEGRGMMQLVYDIAPQTKLMFASGGNFEKSMANGINAMVAGGAKVIVDDLINLGDPFYQDGYTAQAYAAARAAGVVCISSAGNYGTFAYNSLSFQTASDPFMPGAAVYDFDVNNGGNTRNTMVVPAGQSVSALLQWDDPYYAGNVDSDLDLYVLDTASGALLLQSSNNNIAQDYPQESVNYTNSSSSSTQIDFVIVRKAGTANPGRLHLGTDANPNVPFTLELGSSHSITGHNGSPNVITVAAAGYTNQRVPENFTSIGGTYTHLFAGNGTPLATPLTFTKPDITGTDATNTSFFGVDNGDPDTFPNFSGTSAAAPHIAGIAALMIQKAGVNPLAPDEIANQLRIIAARNLDSPGWDPLTGWGLIDGRAAVYGTHTVAQISNTSPYADDMEDGLGSMWELYSDKNARMTIQNVDGVGGSKALVLDNFFAGAKSSNQADLHLNAAIPGITISFRARNLGTTANAGEGIYLSGDGINASLLRSLESIGSTWTNITLDLNLEAMKANHGLSYDTEIQFRQSDDSSFDGADKDGFAIDDIFMSTSIATPDCIWIGAGDGTTWSDSKNWLGGVLPAAGKSVYIGSGPDRKIDVNVATATMKSFISYAPFTLAAGRTFEVTDTMTTYNTVTLDGGTVTGAGVWTAHGGFTWNSGSIDGSGAAQLIIPNDATVTIATQGVKNLRNRGVENTGTVNWNDGSIHTASTANWNNNNAAVFVVNQGSGHWLNGFGTGAAGFHMLGTSEFVKNGPNDLRFEGSITVDATMTISAGTVSATAGGSIVTASVIAGNLELDSGAFTVNDGTSVTGTGRVIINGGTLIVATGQNATFNRLDFANNNTISRSGSGTLTIAVDSNWIGGHIAGGETIVASGGTMTITGTATRDLNGGIFRNKGTVTWNDGGLNSNNGHQFFNEGRFNDYSDDNWNAFGGSTVVLKSTSSFFRDQKTNNTIFNIPVTLDGAITVISGGAYFALGGTVVSPVIAGTVALRQGTFTAATNANITGAGRLLINGGTLKVNALETASVLHVDIDRDVPGDTSLDISGTLTLKGDSTWTGGYLRGTGTMKIDTDIPLAISGPTSRGIEYLTVQNHGTATWTDGTINVAFGGGWVNNSGSKFKANTNGDHWLFQGSGARPAFAVLPGSTFEKDLTADAVRIEALFLANGTFDIKQGTLELAGGGLFNSSTVKSGTVTVSSSITAVANAYIGGTGRVAVNGGTLVMNAGQTATFSALDFTSGSEVANIGAGGKLIIADSGMFAAGTVRGTGTLFYGGGGTFQITTTASHIIEGPTVELLGVMNWLNGPIVLNNGTTFTVLTGAFVGGTFAIRCDDDHITHSTGAYGTFRVEPNAKLLKDDNTNDVTVAYPVVMNGKFEINTGTVSFLVGGNIDTSTLVSGTLELEAGIFTGVNNAAVSGPGKLVLNAGGYLTVPLNMATSISNIDVISSSAKLAGAGTLTVTQSSLWSAGTQEETGKTIYALGSTLTIDGSVALYTRALELKGTANWNSGDVIAHSNGVANQGGLTVKDGGKFNAINSGRWWNNGGYPSLPITLETGGTFIRTAAAKTTSIEVPFHSSGTIDVAGGTLNMAAGGIWASTVVPQNAVRLISGTFTTTPDASISGAGTVLITGTGTVTIPNTQTATFTNLDIDSDGASLRGLGTAIITKSSRWNDGNHAENGKTIFANGSTVTMDGTAARGNLGRYIELAGTANWTAGNTIAHSDGNPTLGLFTILPTGTLNVSNVVAWTNNTGHPIIPFDTKGTINVSAGELILDSGGTWSTSSITQGSVLLNNGIYTAVNGAMVTGAGRMRIGGNATFTLGTGVAASVSNLDLISSGAHLSGAGTVTVTSSSQWSAGTQEGTGTTVYEIGSMLSINGSVALTTRTVDLKGTGNWNAGDVIAHTNGVANTVGFTVKSGGAFNAINDGRWLNNTGYTALPFTVETNGTFTRTAAAKTTSMEVPLNSSGTFVVAGGTLNLTAGGTWGSTVIPQNAVRLTGGMFTTLPNASISGSGTLSNVGATITIPVTQMATFTNLELLGDGAWLRGLGTAIITNTGRWNDGNQLDNGKTIYAVGSTMTMDGTAARGLLGRYVELAGTANWTAGNTIANSDGNPLVGGFTIMPTGLLNVSSVVAWTNNSGHPIIPFDTKGTINVSAGELILDSGGTWSTSSITQGSVLLNNGIYTAVNGAVVTGAGRMRIGGNATFTLGTGVAASVANLDLITGGANISGLGTLTITSSSNWDAGYQLENGKTIYGPGSTLTLSGTDRALYGRFAELQGTMNWSAGHTIAHSNGYPQIGGFTVKSGGIVNITGANLWYNNSGYPASPFTLDAGATLNRSTSTGTTVFGSAFNSSGTINVSAGNLQLANGGDWGSTSIPQGTVTFTGGTFTVANNASITGAGRVTVTNGLVTIPTGKSATFTNFDLVGDNAQMGGLGTFTITGSGVWNGGGDFIENGKTIFGPTSTVTMDGTIRGNLGRYLELAGTANWSSGNTIAHSNGNPLVGGFTIMPTGTLNVSGVVAWTNNSGYPIIPFDHTGTINVTAGELILVSGGTWGTSKIQQGAVRLVAGVLTFSDGAVATGAGVVMVDGSAIVRMPAGKSASISNLDIVSDGGSIDGLGTITVTQSGRWVDGNMFENGRTIYAPGSVLTLEGAAARGVFGRNVDAYGTVNWTAGETIAHSNGYPQIGGFTVKSGAVVNITGANLWYNNSGYPASPFTLDAGATLNRSTSTGTTVFGSAFNSSGTINVSAGNLQLANGGDWGSTSIPQGTVTFTGGTFTVANNASITGAGRVTVTNGLVTIPTGKSATFTNFDLVGDNAQMGGLGTFTITGSGVWNGGGDFIENGKTIFGPTSTVTMDGTIRGNLGRYLELAGTANWSSGNTIAHSNGYPLLGGFTVKNGGTFNLQCDNGWYSNGGYPTPPVTVEAGGVLNRSTTTGIAFFNGGLTNAGTVNVSKGTLNVTGDYVQSSGRTILQGVLDPASTVVLNGGTLEGTGTVLGNVDNTAGTVKPGMSPGTLSIVGDYTQSGGYEVELHGTAVGDFDKLEVFGSVNLGGPLMVVLDNYFPQINDKFTILANDAGDAITGTFAGKAEGEVFTAGGLRFQISYTGITGNDVTLTYVPTAPVVEVVINNGNEQRSLLQTITVNFSTPVTFPNGLAAAISLTRTGPGSPTGVVPLTFASLGNSVTLTFNDPLFAPISNSLIDGTYTLFLTAPNIVNNGLALDGNGDGTAGDDFTLSTHRLMGDANGDRTINGADLVLFGNAFSSSNPLFDYNIDGTVNGADLDIFGNRFGTTY